MPERLLRWAGILALLFVESCGWIQAVAGGGHAMQIPYDAAAGPCYRDLKKAPVLGPGLEQMLAAARREGALEARLHDVQEIRSRLVKDYRALAQRDEAMREESLFVCAANDMLEAMFSAEAEAIRTLPEPERARRADAATRLLNGIHLDPQWNDSIRPRIAEKIRKQKSPAR
jgi:hypothetical protein